MHNNIKDQCVRNVSTKNNNLATFYQSAYSLKFIHTYIHIYLFFI